MRDPLSLRLVLDVTLCGVLLHPLSSLAAQDAPALHLAVDAPTPLTTDQEGYTINFNNVSIIEYIRFVAKITNKNFVFDEGELQFNVTIVSEEPISARNVMSALIQVLRIHGLTLLEEGNNLLITKSTTVTQIPTIVSSDLPDSKPGDAPIITRVFRIKNANPNSIAAIIRPMTSQQALIEVSIETRQLIVTDITTNVEKISSLLASLDAPHTPLEIDSYSAKNVSLANLTSLAHEIANPFLEGNPLILVPQMETNTIFIVSTPYIVDRVLAILEDLDTPPQAVALGQKPLTNENVFIYRIRQKDPQQLLSSLNQIVLELKATINPPMPLVNSLETVRWIPDSNSLLFVGDPETIAKVKDFLTTLDASSAYMPGKKVTFYVYKIKSAQPERLETSIRQMASNLAASGVPDPDFIEALNSMRWIKESNSLVFTGTQQALLRLEEILPTLDVAGVGLEQVPPSGDFFIYNPKQRSGAEIYASLQELGSNLKAAGLSDPDFLRMLETMKWIPATNSLIFTGDAASLARARTLLEALDVSGAPGGWAAQIFLYHPQFATPEQLQQALRNLAGSLDAGNPADQDFMHAVETMKWMGDTQSFLFKGSVTTIERIKEVLHTLDTPKGIKGVGMQTFYLYKLQNAQGTIVLHNLKEFAKNLTEAGAAKTSLIDAINTIKWIKETNSLLLTGLPGTIEELKTLIYEFDVPQGVPPTLPQKTAFLIYKPVDRSPESLQAALNDLSSDLQASGLIDPDLLQAIGSVRYVPSTKSLLFTGTADALQKLQPILSSLDTSLGEAAPVQQIGSLTFLIYKVQAASGPQLIASLQSFANELDKSKTLDKDLSQTLHSMRWIKETNSILFTGTPDALQKAEALAQKFDIPSPAPPQPPPSRVEAPSTYVLYSPRFQTGPELISILCDFESNLVQTGVCDQELFDAINNLKWIDKTSSLLITGTQSAIAKVHQLLEKFDIPSAQPKVPAIETIDNTSFLVYKLQYQQGADIQQALRLIASDLRLSREEGKTPPPDALVRAINSVQTIAVTNSLLATGDPVILSRLKELIQNLDIPLKQVFFEILLIETAVTNAQNFGLQWAAGSKYLTKWAGMTNNLPTTGGQFPNTPLAFGQAVQGISATTTPLPTQVPIQSGFDLGIIGDVIMHKGNSFLSLGSFVSALQQDTDATIITNTKVVTQDNNNTTLFIGQNIPFVGSTVQNVSSNTTTSTSIEYRDVGTSISLTPVLGEDDVITLTIQQNISAVTNNSVVVSGTVTGIQTSQTTVNTRVTMPDRTFLCLTGAIQDNKTHFRTQIPCLGGLPVIGLAFTENNRNDSKSSFIIFIRPSIIHSFQEYKEVTKFQEDLYKEQLVLPVIKEQFDDGVNWIKTPEDE
jgi:type II secretory pathway component GspD/PulD (secretin)